MSKVLVISTSPRANSNSDALADEFARGAKDAGHEVEKIAIREKNIQFCKGCLACTKRIAPKNSTAARAAKYALSRMTTWAKSSRKCTTPT